MGVGGGAPEGRKYLRNFVEIGNVKFKNLITFQKLHEFFCTELDKNIRIIETFIRPGVRGRSPPMLANFCEFHYIFLLQL